MPIIEPEKKENFVQYFKHNYALYLFLVPAVVLTIIFNYIPMYGAVIAFKDFSPMKGILGSDWVGFKHFKDFLTSPNFLNIFMNTIKLSSFDLLIGFPVPIILALMLNQVRRAKIKKNIQLILYAPNFISVVIITGMIFILFSPTGPVNTLLSFFTR